MSVDHWHARAACRDWLDVFEQTFDSGSRTPSRVHQLAADVCGGCPVLKNCLRDALSNEGRADRFGMRAGLMPVERARLARQSV